MAAQFIGRNLNDKDNGRSCKNLSEEEIEELVKHYGRKHPTSTSLETLVKTAQGELLHKHHHGHAHDHHRGHHSHHDDDVAIGTSNGAVGVDIADDDVSEAERVNIQVANFLRRELPVRLAHRIQDLSSVPYLRDMDSVKEVKDIYVQSLLQISSVPPIRTPQQEEEFARELERLYEKKHSNVLIQMAKGAYQLRKQMRKGEMVIENNVTQQQPKYGNNPQNKGKESSPLEFEQMQQCHTFLDRFYMSRIGIRVLAGQYLALREQRRNPHIDDDDYIGIICKTTSPHHAVLRAAEDATWMCQRRFGDAPEVVISGNLDLTFAYIPNHLHYILLELIKNAMRATMEKHRGGGDDDEEAYWNESDEDVPPVHVVIADGTENEDVVIKVSDEGGGIPRSHIKKIWSYLFTTASPSIQERLIAFGSGEDSGDERSQMQDHGKNSPLAGLGYGLPISRSYARYFGGDLSIMSMEGYGTDCFLHLRRLGNTREPLPF